MKTHNAVFICKEFVVQNLKYCALTYNFTDFSMK